MLARGQGEADARCAARATPRLALTPTPSVVCPASHSTRPESLALGALTAYEHRLDPQRISDHARGAALGLGIGLAGGLGALACRHSLLPGSQLLRKGSIDVLAKSARTGKRGWKSAQKAIMPYLSIGGVAGTIVGGKMLPIRKYWAETSLAGMPYTGHTATGDRPRTPRPGLLSIQSLRSPWTVPLRIVTFQWGAVDGTIAADTDHLPFGTRVFVPGYGWGKVADRGSMVAGPGRVDLFHSSHEAALRWGKKSMMAKIQWA